MKHLAALLLIISFVGVGTFSFALFDHAMMDGSDSGCVASAIDGGACPTSIMGMTLHHISALQALTTTVPASFTWLVLIGSLLLISASIFLFSKNKLLPKQELLPRRLQDLTLDFLRSRQKITSWLAFFELSPALQ